MTTDIANPKFINRQFAMMGCGMTASQVEQLMTATDESITKGVSDGRAMLAKLSGDKADRCAKMLRAFEIEAEMRGI